MIEHAPIQFVLPYLPLASTPSPPGIARTFKYMLNLDPKYPFVLAFNKKIIIDYSCVRMFIAVYCKATYIGYKKLDTFLFGFLLTFSISFRVEMSCVCMREKEREREVGMDRI